MSQPRGPGTAHARGSPAAPGGCLCRLSHFASSCLTFACPNFAATSPPLVHRAAASSPSAPHPARFPLSWGDVINRGSSKGSQPVARYVLSPASEVAIAFPRF